MNSQEVLGTLVQRIGSANWSQWQIQRWQWYDFVRVPNTGAVTTSLSFFSVAQGGQDPVSATSKTLEQTNMVKSNTFGQTYFICQELRTWLRPLPKARQTATTAADTDHSFDQLQISVKLRQAWSTGVLTWAIGQKLYLDINQPFRTCPPGFGLGVSSVVVPFNRATDAAGNLYVQQSANLSDVFTLSPPQLIEPEQQFQLDISFPDLGYNFASAFVGAAQNANVEAGVILDGYIARPVQ